MGSGAYLALSGLQTRIDQLDLLSADVANAGTTGYKGQGTSTYGNTRPTFDQTLKSAVDPTLGEVKVNFQPGTIAPTGRALDFAINGKGFFMVDTAAGPRYTRAGGFVRLTDGTLATADDHSPVEGIDDRPIVLPPAGQLTVDSDGTIRVNGAQVGQVKIVDFQNYANLQRQGAARFSAIGEQPTTVDRPDVVSGALEQSNVSVERDMARVVELSRTFDAMNKGISVLMNDVERQAITQLGKP
ncbi:MAG: flagellar hook basal-body protein [Acidobacteriota bacterium]|nr:flagellar hook basal-body protein [Acidobacteriota bacterium]